MNKLLLLFLVLIILGINASATDIPGIPGNCGIGLICGGYEKCDIAEEGGCCYGQCIPKTCSDLGGETCTSGQDCFGGWSSHGGPSCCTGYCFTATPETMTCSELNGNQCGANQYCNGTIEYASDGECCIGTCEDTEDTTCNGIHGEVCTGAEVCYGDAVPSSDYPDEPYNCCINGYCANQTPPPTCSTFNWNNGCSSPTVCDGRTHTEFGLNCCEGKCKTPINFYVCNQGFLANSDYTKTIDLGVYWETALENIEAAPGCSAGNYSCLNNYPTFICLTNKNFSSYDKSASADSLYNLFLTGTTTTKTNLAKLIYYLRTGLGTNYTMKHIDLGIDSTEIITITNTTEPTIFGPGKDPTQIKAVNGTIEPSFTAWLYASGDYGVLKNSSGNFKISNTNYFHLNNSILQGNTSTDNVQFIGSPSIDFIYMDKSGIANLSGSTIKNITVNSYIEDVYCGLLLKGTNQITGELAINDSGFICSIGNDLILTPAKLNSLNGIIYSDKKIDITSGNLSIKNSYLWTTTNIAPINVTYNSTGTIDLTNSTIFNEKGNITINPGKENTLNLTGTKIAAGYTSLSNPVYTGIITIGDTTNNCSTITGNTSNSTWVLGSNSLQSTVTMKNNSPKPEFFEQENTNILWKYNCGTSSDTCEGTCKPINPGCDTGEITGNGTCLLNQICCIEEAITPQNECTQHNGSCVTTETACETANGIPATYDGCTAPTPFCCVPAGSGSEPVPTIIKVTGFITDASYAGINESINLEVVNSTCIKNNVQLNQGLFSTTLSGAGCSFIPNSSHNLKVTIGSTEFTIPFYT
ncbi:MAG: hypothetical protein JW703_01935 [Candidatus Diapherotrites archaeon]|nr:hypothetical protein [Candidatus Diapherotrites archaeon]